MSLFRKKGPALFTFDGEHDHAHPKKGKLWYDLKQRIVHREIRGQRLMVTMTAKFMEYPDGRIEAVYDRTNTWTRLKPYELELRGFKRCERLYDSIVWWGVPVYLKLQDFRMYDITADKEPDGSYTYSQDTPATLNDFMRSNATEKFIRGMAKTGLPEMDLQKLVMMGIVAVGAVIGLWMLGII